MSERGNYSLTKRRKTLPAAPPPAFPVANPTLVLSPATAAATTPGTLSLAQAPVEVATPTTPTTTLEGKTTPTTVVKKTPPPTVVKTTPPTTVVKTTPPTTVARTPDGGAQREPIRWDQNAASEVVEEVAAWGARGGTVEDRIHSPPLSCPIVKTPSTSTSSSNGGSSVTTTGAIPKRSRKKSLPETAFVLQRADSCQPPYERIPTDSVGVVGGGDRLLSPRPVVTADDDPLQCQQQQQLSYDSRRHDQLFTILYEPVPGYSELTQQALAQAYQDVQLGEAFQEAQQAKAFTEVHQVEAYQGEPYPREYQEAFKEAHGAEAFYLVHHANAYQEVHQAKAFQEKNIIKAFQEANHEVQSIEAYHHMDAFQEAYRAKAFQEAPHGYEEAPLAYQEAPRLHGYEEAPHGYQAAPPVYEEPPVGGVPLYRQGPLLLDCPPELPPHLLASPLPYELIPTDPDQAGGRQKMRNFFLIVLFFLPQGVGFPLYPEIFDIITQ